MDFYPWLGGVLIGTSALILFYFNGRVLGASGISSLFFSHLALGRIKTTQDRFELVWRGCFLAGLILPGLFFVWVYDPGFSPQPSPAPYGALGLAGLMVGLGTRMGLGCTSGHGVCGISRFSLRSVLATLLFMGAGVFTVYIVNLILGGPNG